MSSSQHQFARYASVDSITFKNTNPANPLINVTNINYIREEGVTGIFTKKEYRYSFNNKDFSNWSTLTIFALQSIQLSGNSNLYLEIRYSRVGVNSGDIDFLYLLYTSSEPAINPIDDASINADYFQGKLPEYYLDNNNHFGDKFITTLDVSNNYWHTTGITSVLTPTISGNVNYVGDIGLDGSLAISGNILFDSSGTISGLDTIDFWNTNGDPDHLEGRMYYDSTEKAVTYMNDAVDVRVQLGQEMMVRVRNNSGSTIFDGQPVKITGSQGNRPTIELAEAHIHNTIDNGPEFNEIIGLATHDIPDNTDGFVTSFGLVSGQNTSDYAEGALLYVDASPGFLTDTIPTPPRDKISIGIVMNSHANQGKIFVNPKRSIHFTDITGLATDTVPSDKSMWLFNIDTSLWEVTNAASISTYDTVYDDGTLVSDTVGDIQAGTDVSTLKNRTFSSLFDEMLFRTIPPTISANKTLNDSGLSSATLEVGTSQTPTITGTFSRGLILNGNGSAGPELVGLPSEWRFKLPNNTINNTITSTNIIESHLFTSYNIIKGSNIWNVSLDHDAGSGLYYDSKGAVSTALDGSRVAGTSSANSPSRTGAYGFWYGFGTAPTNSAGVRAGTRVLLNQSDGGTFDFTFPDAQTTIWFSTFGTPSYTVTQDPTGLPIDITGLFTDDPFTVDDIGGTARNYQTSEGFYGAAGHGDLTIRIII